MLFAVKCFAMVRFLVPAFKFELRSEETFPLRAFPKFERIHFLHLTMTSKAIIFPHINFGLGKMII